MNSRTLVKASASTLSISFRTTKLGRHSPCQFVISRDDILGLKERSMIVSQDCGNFAVLRKNRRTGKVNIQFTWLSDSGGRLAGWTENVTLPYEKLLNFAEESVKTCGPREWNVLSPVEAACPKLVFCGQENLHAAIENKTVRRKLVRFLRNNFHWQGTDEIRFYNDFTPYSFSFREFINGKPGICGGLILHGQDNLAKSYYSIHT